VITIDTVRFTIPYPPTAQGKKAWNERYSLNAYWSGKPYYERTKDAKDWHLLTTVAMNRAKTPTVPFESPVIITIFWNDNLDIDNHAAMGKCIVDAMKKRVIKNDSRKWLQGVCHFFHDKPYIEVRVTRSPLE
jgi:Holliday junction resolvase RusA-like endonuclease